jgi:hypothetical protein
MGTPCKVEQAVIAQSSIQPDGSYVVPSSITRDGLTLTLVVTGTVSASKPSNISYFISQLNGIRFVRH